MSSQTKEVPLTDICITRGILNTKDFNDRYCLHELPGNPSFKAKLRKQFRSFRCGPLVTYMFPFYKILTSFYTIQAFLADILAGLTMSILHVPQGMAYGFLAGLKPINGLYTSFFPPLAYFFFGTSRHVSVGTFSVVALLSSEPVDRLSDQFFNLNITANDTDMQTMDQYETYRLKVAVTVTILAGLIQLAMGLFHLGFLVVYISAPLLGGFTCASALHVLVSQLNALFGVQLDRYKGPGRLVMAVIDFFRKVQLTNTATLLVSGICITVLLIFKFLINPRLSKRCPFPIPIELIVLLGGTAVSYFVDLKETYDVRIVGSIPRGLPNPIVPDLSLVPDLIMESCVVSFVALATTVSLVKLYSVRGGYEVCYTQEMTALGLANIFGGFFRSHAASGALARTSAAVSAGMKSQVASLISCTILLLVLTVIGPLLQSVPLCVLSSIIAVSLTGIFMQIADIPKLYRASILDMFVWLVAFLATVFLDVPYGLITGLAFSLLTVLFRTQASFAYELVQVKGTELYVDARNYSEADRIPGVMVLRYGGPLYYANAESFQNWMIKCTQIDPNKVSKSPSSGIQQLKRCANCASLNCLHRRSNHEKSEAGQNEVGISYALSSDGAPKAEKENTLHFVILDTSSWTFVDTVGASVLRDLIHSYARVNVTLLFTSFQSQVRYTLNQIGLSNEELDYICFVSVHDAVTHARQELSQLGCPSDAFTML